MKVYFILTVLLLLYSVNAKPVDSEKEGDPKAEANPENRDESTTEVSSITEAENAEPKPEQHSTEPETVVKTTEEPQYEDPNEEPIPDNSVEDEPLDTDNEVEEPEQPVEIIEEPQPEYPIEESLPEDEPNDSDYNVEEPEQPLYDEDPVVFKGVREELTGGFQDDYHIIQIANHMGVDSYLNCWGKTTRRGKLINVGDQGFPVLQNQVYRFAIKKEDFRNGLFWCDVGADFPKGRYIPVYGTNGANRSSHFYSLGTNGKFYYRDNNGFQFFRKY